MAGLFLDLGSGDGRVVKLALERTRTALGMESDEELYKSSKVKKNIVHGSFFASPFDAEDVIYYYLTGSKDENRLIGKLNLEFDGILILYTKENSEARIEEFTDRLDFKPIDKFNNVLVFKKICQPCL